MLYSVVFYTKVDHRGFQNLRRKHDPYAGLIEDHISLVFPIPEEVGIDTFLDHVRNVAAPLAAFDIHICGIEKSWDHWLLLGITEGYSKIIQLHDDLYTGPLEPYLREDLPYKPHIGIGLFVSDDYDPLNPREVGCDIPRYESVRAEAEKLGLDWWRRFDNVTIVRMNPELTLLENVERIELGA
jgi:hypothetical protein